MVNNHRKGCNCYICKTEEKINIKVEEAKKTIFESVLNICDKKEVTEGEETFNILVMKEKEFNELKGDVNDS